MPTYRLTVEYEGTRYSGWQEQKNARTVAGELRRASEEVVGGAVELGGAGRTDAGVHALGQTAHLRLARRFEPEALAWGINERLPVDIHVLRAEAVPAGFHARHDAEARCYLYQISRRRSALAKRFIWWVKGRLSADAMAAALQRVGGRHDFAAFCERGEHQESTLVVVDRAELAEAGDLVLIRLVASHFLWKMVRRLVGTLVRIGQGELAGDDFAALLAAPADRQAAARVTPAAWTAPPSGLFLERVLYPGDPELGPLLPATPLPSPPRRRR